MATDRNTAIRGDQILKHTLQLDDLSPNALVWQHPVEDKDLTTPPGSPSEGVRYLIISGGSGTDWAGHDNDIAQYISGSWVFYTPVEGWFVWIKDENKLYKYNGSSWTEYTGAGLSASDVDDFTIKYVNNELKIADRIELNTMLNAFRIQINGSLSQFNMVDGISDEFEDESGIDTVNSLNEDYDSTNDLYKPIVVAALELDYMEYANDGAAQAAYVSSDATEAVDTEFTSNNDALALYGGSGSYEKHGQSFQVSAGGISCSKVDYYIKKTNSPTDNLTLRIETDNAGVPSGTLVHANATKTIAGSGLGAALGWEIFTFSASFALSGSTTYWIVLSRSGVRDTTNFYRSGYNNAGGYANGVLAYMASGSWSAVGGQDINFKIYSEGNLQCYSESTIKNQDSYSLKGVALITNSLNDTLTKSGLSIDLSGKSELKIDCYASRTGTNLQLQIHDSGGTTSTKDIVISSADTWTEITWDISGISNANKDAIDSIIIKIINADASNIFYIDNFRAPGITNNMTLINNAETAEAIPSDARIVLFEEDVDSITENTDLKAYVSRDGGSTYAQVTLTDEGDYASGKRILTGVVDLTQSGVGSGTSMEYKITTHNAKSLKLHGCALHWD